MGNEQGFYFAAADANLLEERLMSEHHWMGRPLSELSREELITVIDHLGVQLRSYQTPQAIHAMSVGEVQMLKSADLVRR